MEKINEYISRLETLKDELKSNLRDKGLNIPDHYTFSELVPKVNEISSGSSGSEEYEWGYGRYNICIFNTKALITNFQQGKTMDTFVSEQNLIDVFEFRNPLEEGFEGFPEGENLVMKLKNNNGEEKFIPVVYTNNITIGNALSYNFKTVGREDALRNKVYSMGSFLPL